MQSELMAKIKFDSEDHRNLANGISFIRLLSAELCSVGLTEASEDGRALMAYLAKVTDIVNKYDKEGAGAWTQDTST